MDVPFLLQLIGEQVVINALLKKQIAELQAKLDAKDSQ